MFAYLTKNYHYSESAALRRLKVARGIRKVPQLLHALEEGCLDLTAASMIAGLKCPKHILDILDVAKGKTYRELEALVRGKQPEMLSQQRDKIKTISVLKLSEEGFPSNPLRIQQEGEQAEMALKTCLLYTSPSPRDATLSRMPSSA